MASIDHPGSKLIVLGVLMMLVGPVVANQLESRVGTEHPMTLPLALAIDGFKIVGLLSFAPLIIGLLRTRKSKKGEGPRA